MDQTSYPRRPSSYQPFLSLMWGNHGTAADAVAELARHKARVRMFREKYSFETEDKKKYLCPMLLGDLLRVLPENEPLPPRGAGGAPGVPFRSLANPHPIWWRASRSILSRQTRPKPAPAHARFCDTLRRKVHHAAGYRRGHLGGAP